jgi:hypothetical protein
MVAEQDPQLAELATASLKLAHLRLQGLVVDTKVSIVPNLRHS